MHPTNGFSAIENAVQKVYDIAYQSNQTLKKRSSGTIGDVIQSFGVDKFTSMLLGLVRTTLVGIVYALEAKDAYSCHHSQRVATMTERFCKVLRLSESKVALYRLTAEVHDIGKIGIPDQVLMKHARLDDEEFALMRSHPNIGMDIIHKMVDPSDGIDVTTAFTPLVHDQILLAMTEIQEGVHHHHERWDGHGYPGKIAGEEIPYAARIIALCDSTDAMLTNRVYRKALPVSVCKEEIARNAGVMYDPKLADIFLIHWDDIVGDLYGAPHSAPTLNI